MPIDYQNESILTFSQAARSLPGTTHISTIHRWRLRGIRGVKLESCLIGGNRYTSKEALHRFVNATTKAADGIEANCKKSERTCRPSSKLLDDAGI